MKPKKWSVLGGILLMSMLAFTGTSFWNEASGDPLGNTTLLAQNESTGSTSTGTTETGTTSTTNDQWENTRASILDRINSTLDSRLANMSPSLQTGFLERVLGQVDEFRSRIESEIESERRTQYLSLLDEIRTNIQSRMDNSIGLFDFGLSDLGAGTTSTTDGTTGAEVDDWIGGGTTTATILPPTISTPLVTSTTNTNVTISADISEAGTYYYIAIPGTAETTTPTASQIRSGRDAMGSSVSNFGQGQATAGTNRITITGLSPRTSYTIYLTASDRFNYTESSVVSVTFTTTDGGTIGATDWTTGNTTTGASTSTTIAIPTIANITDTSAVVYVNLSGAGTGYYVVLPSNSTTPSASQIQAWQDASWASVSRFGSHTATTGSNQINLIGLTPNTSYIVYYTITDANGNLQSGVTSTSFTTLATGTTGAIGGVIGTTGTVGGVVGTTGGPTVSSLVVDGTINTGLTLSATINWNGIWHYVILPSWSPVPTASQVRLGQDATGASVGMLSSGRATTGTAAAMITGLSPNTSYVLYFMMEDLNGNIQPNVYAAPIVAQQ